MRNNILKRAVALVAALASLTMTAQDLKQFSLEDLNFGGTNYRNMLPKDLWTQWWGDQLMYQDVDDCGIIDMKTGKKTALFTLDDVNKVVEGDKVHTAAYATFPYASQTVALLSNGKKRMLYDWKKKQTVWEQTAEGEGAADWCAASKAVAYVKDCQLHVRRADNTDAQLTTDGSREIVYGQSVHRDEFGIRKGTYWSPDGQRLAFYRMDQSMVADYPQVNTFEREATYEPDKYPMAGMTSHKVTVGVYDLATGKTIYLKAGDPTDRYFTNISWSPDATTTMSTSFSKANAFKPPKSSALMFTFSPHAAVPGLPGAMKSLSTRALCAIFHASACSRPPLPNSSMFIVVCVISSSPQSIALSSRGGARSCGPSCCGPRRGRRRSRAGCRPLCRR